MQKENILLIISVILSIAILGFSIYISIPKNTTQNEDINTEEDSTPEPEELVNEVVTEEEQEIPETTFTQSAWIPSWDFKKGFESLKLRKETITRVHPVLYSLNNNGTLMDRKPSESTLAEFLAYTKTENILVIPTVGSYDFKIMESVLNSEVYIEKSVNEIVEQVEKYNYDGIDIDYEKIKTANRVQYLSFLSKLSTKLKEKGKLLSVTVSAKTRDSSVDTLYAQDWIEINKVADSVNIMTYDYTLQSSTIPGPIGPLDWISDVIEYSKGKINPQKIFLGIHLYSYLWKEQKATALTYSSTTSILSNSKIERKYLEDFAEGYASYTCADGSKCILFYPTKEGVKERIEISRENKLAGVVYWRLGDDGNILDTE